MNSYTKVVVGVLLTAAVGSTVSFGVWLVDNVYNLGTEQVVIEHKIEAIYDKQDTIVNMLDKLGAQ